MRHLCKLTYINTILVVSQSRIVPQSWIFTHLDDSTLGTYNRVYLSYISAMFSLPLLFSKISSTDSDSNEIKHKIGDLKTI